MTLTPEMKKMLNVLESYDHKLRDCGDLNKRYIAPNIPDKITKKLIKFYDNHIPVTSIIAFYDDTLFHTCKSGIIFTCDGFYHKYLDKPVFLRYCDIKDIYFDKHGIYFRLNDSSEYDIICTFDKITLIRLIKEMIAIDEEFGQSTFTSSGKVKKIDMPDAMMKKCKTIIHSASVACGGVGTGMAQIPTSDNAVIVPIQIGMIVGLGSVFELNITESTAKSIIASAGASIAGRTISQLLVGWIPVIGNAINTATASGITEAIGWIAVRNFYARWLEDKNKGRLDGMKDGYTQASGEYECKLRRQADEFLNQIKDYRRENDEYETLLNEYEAYIKELEAKSAATATINEMTTLYKQLQNLKR